MCLAVHATLCTQVQCPAQPPAGVSGQSVPAAPLRASQSLSIARAARVRKAGRLQVCSAAVPDVATQLMSEVAEGLPVFPVPALAVGVAVLTGLAAWRFAVYGRLQYITAAMLGRWVPTGKAKVIQIGGGSRDLFYYPKDTILVTAISPKLNKGMMGQAGVQAGVPVEVRQETPSNLAFQANSSVDAVVCLQSLHTIQDQPRFLAEVQRVLLPGSPFIFLQPVKGQGLAAAAQLLLGGAGKALDESQFERIKQVKGFSSVEWDVALAGQNPHVVGVATTAAHDSEDREAARPASRSAQRRKKTAKSGFGGPSGPQ